jgi:hypothetical protein
MGGVRSEEFQNMNCEIEAAARCPGADCFDTG